MDGELTGLRALVTSSSSGLGLASADAIAAAGASVVITGRRADQVDRAVARLREHGRPVHGVPADITRQSSCVELVSQAAELLNGVDLLCLCTPGPVALVPLQEATDLDDWRESFQRQFLPIVWLLTAALPLVAKSANPAVAVVTSTSVREPMGDHVYSTVPRAATTAVAKALTRLPEVAHVRINAIAPVSIATPTFLGRRDEEALQRRAEGTPLGRLGQPREFAEAVVFALGPRASYLTGQTLFVDGGSRESLL